MIPKHGNIRKEGFTFIELMIVITIIGIIAAIAIPNFLAYRKRSFNAAALSDAKNAYTAAQNYFNDTPEKTLSNKDELVIYGYVSSQGVVFKDLSGTQLTLQFILYHATGDKTYTVNANGDIFEE